MVTWRGSWRVRSSKAEQARVPSSVVTDRSGLIWIIKRGGSPGKPRQHPTWARYAPSYAASSCYQQFYQQFYQLNLSRTRSRAILQSDRSCQGGRPARRRPQGPTTRIRHALRRHATTDTDYETQTWGRGAKYTRKAHITSTVTA